MSQNQTKKATSNILSNSSQPAGAAGAKKSQAELINDVTRSHFGDKPVVSVNINDAENAYNAKLMQGANVKPTVNELPDLDALLAEEPKPLKKSAKAKPAEVETKEEASGEEDLALTNDGFDYSDEPEFIAENNFDLESRVDTEAQLPVAIAAAKLRGLDRIYASRRLIQFFNRQEYPKHGYFIYHDIKVIEHARREQIEKLMDHLENESVYSATTKKLMEQLEPSTAIKDNVKGRKR